MRLFAISVTCLFFVSGFAFSKDFQHLEGKNKRCPVLSGKDVKDIAREEEGLRRGSYLYQAAAPSKPVFDTYKVLSDDDAPTFKRSSLMGRSYEGALKTLCMYIPSGNYEYLKTVQIVSTHDYTPDAPKIALHEEGEVNPVSDTPKVSEVLEVPKVKKEGTVAPRVVDRFRHPFAKPNHRCPELSTKRDVREIAKDEENGLTQESTNYKGTTNYKLTSAFGRHSKYENIRAGDKITLAGSSWMGRDRSGKGKTLCKYKLTPGRRDFTAFSLMVSDFPPE